MTIRSNGHRSFAFALALLGAACREPSAKLESPFVDAGTVASAAPQVQAAPASRPVLLDWLEPTSSCTLGHRGALIDMGDAALSRVRVRGGKSSAGKPDAVRVEHEGASWLRVTGRELTVPFLSPFDAPADVPTAVELRAKAGVSRSVTVLVNGKLVGAASFAKQGAKILSLKAATSVILPGENELELRFSGNSRGVDAAADIDWVRVGPADGETSYAAPTRLDAFANATVGKVTRRSVQLRGNSYMRCHTFVPEGSRFSMDLGLIGEGEGDVEVRVLRDKEAPVILGAYHVASADGYRPIDVALPQGAGFAEVAVVVTKVSKGARMALGEPKLVGPEGAAPRFDPKETSTADAQAPTKTPTAKGVVLVVMSSLPAAGISVYGGSIETPELGALAATGLVYDDHRATTSLATGNLATMLTGLPASAHGVVDSVARLPKTLTTIAGCAKQGGVTAAMFTANPTTSAAFGFERDWHTFRYLDPTEGAPATRIFDDAAEWLQKHSNERFLLVIHARAGHPPWDALREELKEMPPQNYSGGMDPKLAGEFLYRVRKARNARFTEQDRTRLWALHSLAIRAHDAALGRFLNTLRSTHRDEDTTLLVTSDVGVDQTAHVPFGEGDSLDEAVLRLTMVLRPPASQPEPAARVTSPSSPEDVGRTILQTLGLPAPDTFGGVDLWSLARGARDVRGRLRSATTGDRYAHAWDAFVLTGSSGGTMRLCARTSDPACATDLKQTLPITFATFAARADELRMASHTRSPETVALDFALSNALRAWGRGEP